MEWKCNLSSFSVRIAAVQIMLSSTTISPSEENNGSGRNPIEKQGKRRCQSSRRTIRNEKSMFRGVTRYVYTCLERYNRPP